MEQPKPITHVVLVSNPGLGHLIPVIELGKRFVLHQNLKVTIIAVTSETSRAEIHTLNSAVTSSFCHVIHVPSPDISNLIDQNDRMATRLWVMMRESKPAIKSILSKITPPPSALILDVFCTESIPLARELNIPTFVYIASHAWFLSILLYSPTLDEKIQGQYFDQKKPLKIPGCNSIRPEDLVDQMQDRNHREYRDYLDIAKAIPQSDGVLVNTWEELQHKDLQTLREGGLLSEALNMKIPIYAVGPLVRQPKLEKSSLTHSVMTWLDSQPSESVVYVSFGSGGTMSFEQMKELAWGLELSERRFVWVVRAPIEGAADAAFFTTGCDESDDDVYVEKYLPEGFLSRTNKVGVLINEWAPQASILRHGSIGGFVSHCGWGSSLESLTNGKPLVAWPLYAEQRMNATLLAEELGVAVRTAVLPTKKVVGREEVAKMVKDVIPGDDNLKRNSDIRQRVKEVQRSAMKALSEGGSSCVALSNVARTIMGK